MGPKLPSRPRCVAPTPLRSTTMLNIQEIVSMQVDCVERWHRESVDNPFTHDDQMTTLLATACQQHQFNYLLWHEEDIARSRDVTDAKIAEVKRNIDRYNQARNDWIEKIDDWITADLDSNSIQSASDAKLNTETPGSAMDRLSIMSLRIYHLDEQLQRNDVDAQHIEKVNMRLAICRLQQKDLSQSLQELVIDIYSSVKRHRTYRQMKMYNDPTLNPYLYGRVAKSGIGLQPVREV
jgi:hypothetical protein